MDNGKRIIHLYDDVDEETEKYMYETINSWKEEMMELMYKEVEEKNAAKLEALEKENLDLREKLKKSAQKNNI